jgi:glycosyltransferase involved in cell wall biosynthesis
VRPVALVLVGSRSLNKRASRFAESLLASGFDPVLVAVPRHPWDTSGIEDPAVAAVQGFATLRPAGPRPRRPRRPDLVVCMHWSGLPVAMLLKRLFRTAVIYDEHDHYELLALEGSGPPWLNRARSRWVRRVHAAFLPHTDVVTCIQLAGGRLKHHLEAHATTVIELHNYPSQRWAARDWDRAGPDGSISIVYVGGIWDVKGCGSMLDAYVRVAGDPSLPALSLQAFGRGDPEIERRLAAAPGVTFHGSTSFDHIVDYLTSHACIGLVLLDATPRYSLVSTNCHKLYEYLASGTPVLATDVGELRKIVADLDGGWTIRAGFDAETLADTLRGIVAQPAELRRRGAAAATAVERDALWWEGEWEKVERLGVLDRARKRTASRRRSR